MKFILKKKCKSCFIVDKFRIFRERKREKEKDDQYNLRTNSVRSYTNYI